MSLMGVESKSWNSTSSLKHQTAMFRGATR
jgi:hypothetical protein